MGFPSDALKVQSDAAYLKIIVAPLKWRRFTSTDHVPSILMLSTIIFVTT